VVTATGMGAITLALNALLQPGDRLVVPHDCYGGSWRLFNALAKKGAFELITCDLTDPRALAEALAQSPKLVLDRDAIQPAAADHRPALRHRCRAQGRRACAGRQHLPVASAAAPIEDFDADFVLHSTTKYINGHSDVVGGAVVSKRPPQHEQLSWWANCLGLTGSPFDSFLTLRGLRTLDARLRVHQENTEALVGLLDAHPAVRRCTTRAWPRIPGHALAARQQHGFGAMLSVELAGGEAAVRAFVDGLQYFTLAESLGGVESLVAHPATMTHAAMSAEARAAAGISDGLLRLSVGIEHADDLLADISAALDRALSCQDKRKAAP
jgi:cystathionine gamma-synthase